MRIQMVYICTDKLEYDIYEEAKVHQILLNLKQAFPFNHREISLAEIAAEHCLFRSILTYDIEGNHPLGLTSRRK